MQLDPQVSLVTKNMHTFSVILLTCLLATAFADSPTPRIVGGVKAPDGKYPYQVQLRDNGRFLCGGSIIGKRHVLTAAHCISGRDASKMTILAGTNVLDGEEGVTYQAEALIPHPKYGGLFVVKNDLGIIRLTEDIKFNLKVSPIELPTENYEDFDKTVTLTGWGKTSNQDPPASDLQEIQLNVLTKSKCKRFWIFVKDTHVCTFTEKGQGACNGDSGGPLVSQDGVQIGIVSFGMPCALGVPDVYTRVYSFIDWINKTVAN